MALTQVKTSGIADDAVTLGKLNGGTDGNLITYDASGNPAVVATGNDGQVLTSQGAGSVPQFETLPTSGAALTGSTNNTVVTVTGADAMQGEANLTFNGSTLTATGDATFSGNVSIGGTTPNAFSNYKVLTVQGGSGGAGIDLEMDDGNIYGRIFGDPNGLQIQSTQAGDYIRFETAGANERMRIDADGDVKIADGNLIMGTSGNGIDFSATTDANNGAYGGTKSDELLHDYEYGTWTPTLLFNGGTTGQSYTTQDGRYTKVGNMLTVQCKIDVQSKGSSTGNITMSGLPWLAKDIHTYIMIQGSGLAYSGTQCFLAINNANANHYWGEQMGGDGNSANWVYLTHAAINNGEYYISGSYVVVD